VRQHSKRGHQTPFLPASEELKSLVAAIEREVSSWPQVNFKSMFGMTAMYRGKAIFGLLPKTRSLYSADSVWMKFGKLTPSIQKKLQDEPRILPPRHPKGARWYTIRDVTPSEYGFTIEWLAIAHAAAKAGRK